MADKKVFLKPCPMCGFDKIEITATVSFKNKIQRKPFDYRVTCLGCCLQTDHAWTFARAVKDWNSRMEADGR